jgi:acyl-homoserine lactone acylase PvdQ
MVEALTRVVAWLIANHGSAEVPYGQVHRVRRGERSWPLSGGESGGGQTLRAITANLDGKVYYGSGGQCWTQVVQLRPGAVRSWSVTPFGQSDDPASPHYADQAAQLVSTGLLKPTWFDPAELADNMASTLVLQR